MKLEQSFEVAAPLERVWAALIDVERVAPCLPGASVTGRNDDGSYNGNFKVKIGPTSAAYAGKLMMETVDEDAHTATMQANGTDKRGQGGASATIVSTVTAGDSPDTTRVAVDTDYRITGRLARFGRGGMIEDISNRLLGEFAKNLQSSLAGGGEDAAAAAAAGEAPDEEAGSETTDAEAGSETPPAAPATPPVESETPPAPGAAAPDTTPPGGPGGPGAPGTPPPTAGNGTPPGFTPPPQPVAESEPVEGLSLMASVMWNQAKRNPAPIVAMVLGFLLALRVFRRRD